MNQSKRDTIDHVCRIAIDTTRRLSNVCARLIGLAAIVGLCVLPFILIQDKAKESFWYCMGAFGLYLIGVAQILGRRL